MRREYDFSKARRGAVIRTPPGKTRITIRIDNRILEWFRKQAHRSGGANYQTMMNEALARYVDSRPEPLESTLRRVIREELSKAG
jgi:uncharacterized protein (DUF4415 family)